MKMRRWVLTAMTAVSIVALAACGGEDLSGYETVTSTTTMTETTTTTETTEVPATSSTTSETEEETTVPTTEEETATQNPLQRRMAAYVDVSSTLYECTGQEVTGEGVPNRLFGITVTLYGFDNPVRGSRVSFSNGFEFPSLGIILQTPALVDAGGQPRGYLINVPKNVVGTDDGKYLEFLLSGPPPEAPITRVLLCMNRPTLVE